MDTWRRVLRMNHSPDLLRRTTAQENLDRFIPNRSAMDMDYAHYMLTGGNTQIKADSADNIKTSSQVAYQKALANALGMNRKRILAFNNKPPTPANHFPEEILNPMPKTKKSQRRIPKGPDFMFDAPELVDDFYLNLLDWSCDNILAVGLGDRVCLLDAFTRSVSELVAVGEEDGPITSLSCSPAGQHVAVGLNNSLVQIWDYTTNQKVRTLSSDCLSSVISMDWNEHILSTGGSNGNIVNSDLRVREHVVGTYMGHHGEVCGLKWSASGRKLASGGNDDLVLVWDSSMTSSNSSSSWLNRFDDHTAAVKALAWCPFQDNLLASGGANGDNSVKFWNIQTGTCLNSIEADSQVTSLIWSKQERELISSHGFHRNQLTLWKYPSMVKIGEMSGHTSRILHMAQSPDGYKVATLGADETLCIWSAFGTPQAKKPTGKHHKSMPFADVCFIR